MSDWAACLGPGNRAMVMDFGDAERLASPSGMVLFWYPVTELCECWRPPQPTLDADDCS